MRLPARLIALAILATVSPAPGHARTLALPVRDPRASGLEAPCYTAEKLELRLQPAAAAAARGARVALPAGIAAGRVAFGLLGVPGVDQAAAALGAWFEPEFRGERPPADARATDFTAYYLVHLPPGGSLTAALDRFAACAEVASVDPIAILPVEIVPNDSLWPRQYWHYQPSRHDIHSPEAWDVTTGDSAIVVGVIDTGVMPYHPDLQGQMWSNPAEVAGAPGVDDDGNGFVDDTWGWDFVDHPSGTTGIIPGEDTVDQDPDPNDFAGHGTFVAGVLGAHGNNGIGPAGMAWHVRIMPLRIGWSTYSNPLGQVDMSYAAQALRYAARMHANIVNCSFATLNTNGLYDAAAAAIKAGVVIIAAAGNNGSPHDLAERADVIAVAATDQTDAIALYSNTGDFVDLAAPGTFFFSTYIQRPGSDSLGLRQPDYSTVLTALSGTSFSSPLVAGAVALVQSLRRARGERLLSPMGALFRMSETADDISAENPSVAGYGSGRLNVYRALTDPPRSLAWPGGARTVGPAVAFDTNGRTAAAWLTSAQQLLIADPATGDTLALTPLPYAPARQLAGARMGGGVGFELFAGSSNGRMMGFDSTGAQLPGFPVSGPTGITPSLDGGPALADVDGDGVRDIVCGGEDGQLWAWNTSGARLANFPVAISALGISAPVACADLDGAPGAEIVAVTREGDLHVVGGDGNELPGFPVTVGGTPFAPAIAWAGDSARIVVASLDTLRVFDVAGNVRAQRALAGNVTQDPALGDLDGDGADDIVVATAAADLEAYSLAGAPLQGWPRPLPLAATGAPVLGHLAGRAAADALVMTGIGLVGLDGGGQRLTAFPKADGAGLAPALLELDGDGATEVLAGTGADSSLVVYDAGPRSWNTTPQPWPTARGDMARTGARPRDALPPAAVTDLASGAITPTSVALTWTAPGDDGMLGRATAYELRETTFKGFAGSATQGTVIGGVAPPDTAGSPQSAIVHGLAPNTTVYFWLRARDDAGNVSACSNVVGLTTPDRGPPLPPEFALSAPSPAGAAPVALAWRVRAGDRGELSIYDVTGRRLQRFAVGPASHGEQQWNGRDAGGHAVPAGVYFARLACGSLHLQTRVVLLP
ncbi:MAG TPA: S8 family serine peptidase [Gemmatimonadales bacterium]|nr:S8 family serine peptidase [Gemmatimonadales bacterium]